MRGGTLGPMSRRRLPSVDRVLSEPSVADLVRRWGTLTVKQAVQNLQAELRQDAVPPDWAQRSDAYAEVARARIERQLGRGYAPVFNLTGILVHSNLGRSPLPPQAAEDALQAATRPPRAGIRPRERAARRPRARRRASPQAAHRRRTRDGREQQRRRGAPRPQHLGAAPRSAGLAGRTHRDRRQLPAAGDHGARPAAKLREIGTTNRTHAADYENAVNERTALLLKVHPSNYRVDGFHSAVGVRELAAIGSRHGLPVCVDAGSGSLLDLRRFGLTHEPTPRELLDAGASLVAFSGDKLLGGAQAGIVVGKRELIERLNANPMKRALRLDKLALALLDSVLKEHENEATAVARIPALAMLALPLRTLEERAEQVAAALAPAVDGDVETAKSHCELGSGALPRQPIESRAVTIAFAHDRQLREFSAALRRLRPAVLGRIGAGRLWLDMRGAEPLDELVATLAQLR